MTKAVILDGKTTNPGDIDFEPLIAIFDEYEIHDRTAPDQVNARIKGADYIFTNKTPITLENIQKADTLTYIGVMATGYDVVDVDAAKDHDVVVTNVAGYGTDSVAQLTFAFILAHVNHVAELNKSVAQGKWIESDDFSYWYDPITELSGKTLGLIGFGDIAQQVARIGNAFNMNITVTNRSEIDDMPFNVTQVDMDDLLAQADFISIHVPLADNTHHLFNKEAFKKMKSTAYLINTARGPIVDEDALVNALENKVIAGAAVDVIKEEPMTEDSPLLGTENLIITPHIAWASVEARKRLVQSLADNVLSFQDEDQKTQNVVN